MGQGYTATVKNEGQVTLPEEVRSSMGIKPGDEIEITVEGDEIRLRRPRYTLETAFGAIPALPGVEPGDFDDMIEEAMEQHADWVVDRMRRGLE
ncbi:MAG: Antidote-toxin recognition MazE, bacterial antitoxin [Thermomicrobiales bacterium]|jgi:AbrB family looped-hinge helix DNA binding protein|nr:Antidote-toxin recognition MazE, bacterial antitoxin [Thermomicrobiales bacterium]